MRHSAVERTVSHPVRLRRSISPVVALLAATLSFVSIGTAIGNERAVAVPTANMLTISGPQPTARSDGATLLEFDLEWTIFDAKPNETVTVPLSNSNSILPANLVIGDGRTVIAERVSGEFGANKQQAPSDSVRIKELSAKNRFAFVAWGGATVALSDKGLVIALAGDVTTTIPKISGHVALFVFQASAEPEKTTSPVVPTPSVPVTPGPAVNPITPPVKTELAGGPSATTPAAATPARATNVNPTAVPVAQKAPSGTLASTGAEVVGFIVAGALVLALGFVLVTVARRRRRA